MILSEERILRNFIKNILIENDEKKLSYEEHLQSVLEFIQTYDNLKKENKSETEMKNELKPLFKKSGPSYRTLKMKLQMSNGGFGGAQEDKSKMEKLKKILTKWFNIIDELNMATYLIDHYRL